jgi:hypothetical protein
MHIDVFTTMFVFIGCNTEKASSGLINGIKAK